MSNKPIYIDSVKKFHDIFGYPDNMMMVRRNKMKKILLKQNEKIQKQTKSTT